MTRSALNKRLRGSIPTLVCRRRAWPRGIRRRFGLLCESAHSERSVPAAGTIQLKQQTQGGASARVSEAVGAGHEGGDLFVLALVPFCPTATPPTAARGPATARCQKLHGSATH